MSKHKIENSPTTKKALELMEEYDRKIEIALHFFEEECIEATN